ncbi:MAG: winged helix-turn-helix domain-containing protein [Actinomycetota bacterium]
MTSRAPLRRLSVASARRLALDAQLLTGPPLGPGKESVRTVAARLRCLQLDPTAVVARSPLLVLFSRIDGFSRGDLDALCWEEKKLFEYFAHAASLVLTDDYQIHNVLMRRYRRGGLPRHKKLRAWIDQNRGLRKTVLREIRNGGPLPSSAFQDMSKKPWRSTGWTDGRNVNQMLEALWVQGHLVVAGRRGSTRLWDLSERWLPAGTPTETIPWPDATHRAARHAMRALGVATPQQVAAHFTRGRYLDLPAALASLRRREAVEEVRVMANGGELKRPWYADTEALERMERSHDEDAERATLLSPFDNLICDRGRTRMLFDFEYGLEIYKPVAQRRFGYFVMPVVKGDHFVGRVDPRFVKDDGRLVIESVHAEPGAVSEDAAAVDAAVSALGTWLGARDIAYSRRLPSIWRRLRRA